MNSEYLKVRVPTINLGTFRCQLRATFSKADTYFILVPIR